MKLLRNSKYVDILLNLKWHCIRKLRRDMIRRAIGCHKSKWEQNEIASMQRRSFSGVGRLLLLTRIHVLVIAKRNWIYLEMQVSSQTNMSAFRKKYYESSKTVARFVIITATSELLRIETTALLSEKNKVVESVGIAHVQAWRGSDVARNTLSKLYFYCNYNFK